jgi:adenylate kinase
MIVFLGPAGSGKSTQGQLLADRLGWTWLSAGQLLRDTHDKNIEKIMNEGQLAPSEVINKIMVEAIKSAPDSKKIILDGFTRKIEEARHLIETTSDHMAEVDLIIVFDVPLQFLLERLKLRGRIDDTPAAVEERLNIYHQEVNEIIQYFEKNNIKISKIDGSGDIESVHKLILKELAKCQLN